MGAIPRCRHAIDPVNELPSLNRMSKSEYRRSGSDRSSKQFPNTQASKRLFVLGKKRRWEANSFPYSENLQLRALGRQSCEAMKVKSEFLEQPGRCLVILRSHREQSRQAKSPASIFHHCGRRFESVIFAPEFREKSKA